MMWPSWYNAAVPLQVNFLFWNIAFSYLRGHCVYSEVALTKLKHFFVSQIANLGKNIDEILIWTDAEIFLRRSYTSIQPEDMWFYHEVKPSCALQSSANSAYQITGKKVLQHK